jgi:hypothetical protein
LLTISPLVHAQWVNAANGNVYTTSGNVGIGTPGPGDKLSVFSASGTTQINIASFNNSTNGAYTSLTTSGSASIVPTWPNAVKL